MPWPKLGLAEVLKQVSEPHRVEVDREYPNFGIFSFGRGLFVKQPISGATTRAMTLYRVRKNQFVYSRLFAFEGAYGLVTEAFDGHYVSNEYPTFETDPARLLPEFLAAYFQWPRAWEEVARRSTGMGDRRRRVQPAQFLQHEFVLPSLPEQRRMVTQIEKLSHQIGEVRELRHHAVHEGERMVAAAEMKLWPSDHLSDAVHLESLTSLLARGRQSEQGETDHFLVKTQHVQEDRYIPTAVRLAPHAAAKVRTDAILRDGDILIACSAAGCLGRVARYIDDGRVASADTHVAIARPNSGAVEPEYLYAYLRGAQGQHQLRSRERGDWQREKVGFRLTELNLADLRKLPVPLPSKEEQRRIVSEVTALRQEVEMLRRLQTETAAELNALLPAVLDRAFKGEL